MKPQVQLDRWQGGKVTLWQYNVSLQRLIIHVDIEGRKGNLQIVCLELSHICSPIGWEEANFELSRRDADTFLLRDVKANFEAQAGVVGMIENGKPIRS